MFWASLGTLSLVVMGVVLYPLARRRARSTSAAKASRLGIGTVGRGLTAAAIALGLPAGAVSLYLYLGMPNQPDRPLAQRTEDLKLAEHARRLDEFSKTLVARLEERPDDAEGWAMLGGIHRTLGRFTESANAFARVHALRPAAERMFMAAVASDPKHVKARFYLGSALAQRPEEIPKAIEVWTGLEMDSPPDAPWLEALRQNIRIAEAELAATTEAPGQIGRGTPTPGGGAE
jgi:cytochrome c-type biogenesis protein CcmH